MSHEQSRPRPHSMHEAAAVHNMDTGQRASSPPDPPTGRQDSAEDKLFQQQ